MVILVSHQAVRYMFCPSERELEVLDKVPYDPTTPGASLLDMCRELNDDFADELYDVLTSDKWFRIPPGGNSCGWTPPRQIDRLYVTHLDCIM